MTRLREMTGINLKKTDYQPITLGLTPILGTFKIHV